MCKLPWNCKKTGYHGPMSVHPEGATELLLALATPTPKGYWGVPVLVWGRPGTGKSTGWWG
ncbi:putative uncharacterized protein [Meiothermus ruber H328]|nr:putative uncharacterized protein [Meiothermus ruber H328]